MQMHKHALHAPPLIDAGLRAVGLVMPCACAVAETGGLYTAIGLLLYQRIRAGAFFGAELRCIISLQAGIQTFLIRYCAGWH